MRDQGAAVRVCVFFFLIYALLTLVMTYPVVARLNTHLVGDGDDMWVHYWNGWWVKRILRQGGDVHHTSLLFHPTGASLLYHNFAWVNIAFWLGLEPLIGGVSAYNVIYLLHITLCGLGMFLLVRRLTRSHAIAFISGLVFAFWPYRMLDVNHPNMISTEGFPLLMLVLFRLFQDERPIREGIIAGLLTALIGYMRWQLLILAGFLVVLYLIYTLIWERQLWNWRTVAGLVLTGVVAAVLMAPALYPLLRDQLVHGGSGEIYTMNVTDRKQDLLTWIVPQIQHPLSGCYNRLFHPYTHAWIGSRFSAFLGHLAVVLSVIGVVKRRREKQTWFWLGLGVLCFVFALGPYLLYNRVLHTNIPMPYRLIGWLPPIRMLRYPHRFNALLAVPVAVLGGYGALAIQEWLANRRWGSRLAQPTVFAVLLGTLILLDYFSVPTSTVSARVPDHYHTLAEEEGDFAVMGLPGKRHHTEIYMFYQIVHSRPLLGGHISRLPPQALEFASSVPLVDGMYESGDINTQLPDVSRQLSLLADASFRYVILHKDLASPEQLAEWRSYFVMSPRYEDEEVVVYPTAPVVGQDCSLAHDLEAGIGLIQADLSADTVGPDAHLELQVIWGTTVPPAAPLQLEVAMVDEAGEVGQMERFAISPSWPIEDWSANAIVRDAYTLRVEPWLERGTHTVVLRLVREEDGRSVGQRVNVGDVRMVAPERSFTVPPVDQRVEASFGNDLHLLGYDLEVGEDAVHITLHWQALSRMDTAYKIFVHLFDPVTNDLVSQIDTVPHDWTYPTTWWDAGEVVSDGMSVPLEDVPAGTYHLAVGVYQPETGERLTIADPPPHFRAVGGRLILPEEVVR